MALQSFRNSCPAQDCFDVLQKADKKGWKGDILFKLLPKDWAVVQCQYTVDTGSTINCSLVLDLRNGL